MESSHGRWSPQEGKGQGYTGQRLMEAGARGAGKPLLLQPFLSSLVCGLPEVLDTGAWCASPLPSPQPALRIPLHPPARCQLPISPGQELVKKGQRHPRSRAWFQGPPPAHWLCDSGQVMLRLGPWFPQHQVGALVPGSHAEMESQCAAATGQH